MSRLSLLCLNLRVKSKDKDTFGQCLHCPYLSGVWGVLSAQENQGRFRRVWCALVARAFRACSRIQNGSWDIFPNTRFNATLEACCGLLLVRKLRPERDGSRHQRVIQAGDDLADGNQLAALTLHALFSHDGRTKADSEKDRNPKAVPGTSYRGRCLLTWFLEGCAFGSLRISSGTTGSSSARKQSPARTDSSSSCCFG